MVGKTISHYRILDKLGEGGTGVVHKARDTHLDRFVAIKVLPPERVAEPERKRRFVQEAKAASGSPRSSGSVGRSLARTSSTLPTGATPAPASPRRPARRSSRGPAASRIWTPPARAISAWGCAWSGKERANYAMDRHHSLTTGSVAGAGSD